MLTSEPPPCQEISRPVEERRIDERMAKLLRALPQPSPEERAILLALVAAPIQTEARPYGLRFEGRTPPGADEYPLTGAL